MAWRKHGSAPITASSDLRIEGENVVNVWLTATQNKRQERLDPSQTLCFRVSATVAMVTAAETRMFKGRHFDRSVILLCVRWYLAYSLSLRDLEEMMAERGIKVDHATIHDL